MADNDYDAVRPIDRLQTVHSLTPTQRRQERKRQQMAQNPRKESEEEPGKDEESDEATGRRDTHGGDSSHLVDYCA